MDPTTPPPDLYGRPRGDRFMRAVTAFGDHYMPALGRPGLRRSPCRPQPPGTPQLRLTVTAHRTVADGVVALHLADPAGAPLPGWQPGARLLLTLPSGRQRHYSLCGDPADVRTYRIAVRRIADGGGGSTEIHDELRPGHVLTARRPRNGFAFCAEPAVLLLAGGIGITPLLPMARQAHALGLDWHLVHTGRTAASLPFTDELRALDPARVEIRTDDRDGPPGAADLLARAPRGAAVYCCGPAPMIDAVRRALDAPPARALHVERFAPAPVADGRPFTLRLGADGPEIAVPGDRTALDAARDHRPDLPYSCRQGFCGTCRVRVLSGTPEHRDRRLTDTERAAGALLPCVSRAAGGETLVLDL
ncbi:PDR/VanB family oxidoreductase [Kitasatospora sp. NBC_01539]|uniref:PDR/VanB family oxidoreductase n=1 Tax=Kitasatospora sp. NBC_01539 TaxID=2903577 RepID=UPI00386013CD